MEARRRADPAAVPPTLAPSPSSSVTSTLPEICFDFAILLG
jgi:hypothetical protein